MDLYADNILDHFRHPRNKQRLEAPSITHEEVNLSCGDALAIDLRIENDRIKNIGWDGAGCAISQAAISMLSEEILHSPAFADASAGGQFSILNSLPANIIYDLLGVPIGSRRVKCALLGLHTLENALHKFRGEKMQGWSETVGDGAAHGN